MIARLRGTLAARDHNGSVVVDVGGVGYAISVTPNTSLDLGEVGSIVTLHVHTRVREDSITLFGFATADEQRTFETLIATHGVGPSLALALLATHEPPVLRTIVATEDAASLAQVPGIGKKTASRLIVELKSRFSDDDVFVDLSDGASTPPSAQANADVVAALAELGYSGEEIRQALRTLPADGTTQELLRLALRELAHLS